MNIRHEYNISTFEKLQINYWGVRKSGCTTMKYILLRGERPKFVERMDKRGRGRNRHGYPNRGWVHNECRYISPTEAKENGFKNIIVLRDPVQRALSMYNGIETDPYTMLKSGSRQFKVEAKKISKNININAFLDLLERFPDKDRNWHYRSQKSYCLFEDIIKLDIDNIQNTIHLINPNLVVNVVFNKSEKRESPSTHIVKRIHEIFKEDFELYDECLKEE
jgi:hypothetical protein